MASSVAKNLQSVRNRIAQAISTSTYNQQCTLVAVSKTKPIEDIQAVYELDQRHFGENYIQELVDKAGKLPEDIQWHYIGHVQSNKAKLLVRDVPSLYCIETVDSHKIANALEKASASFRSEPLNIMIQVNTSEEEQKSGLVDQLQVVELARHVISNCIHLRLIGLMTIGRYGDSTTLCFDRLRHCRSLVAQAIGCEELQLELSMGMSGDFETAIACGSTFVRIGSTIFGERDYSNRQI